MAAILDSCCIVSRFAFVAEFVVTTSLDCAGICESNVMSHDQVFHKSQIRHCIGFALAVYLDGRSWKHTFAWTHPYVIIKERGGGDGVDEKWQPIVTFFVSHFQRYYFLGPPRSIRKVLQYILQPKRKEKIITIILKDNSTSFIHIWLFLYFYKNLPLCHWITSLSFVAGGI